MSNIKLKKDNAGFKKTNRSKFNFPKIKKVRWDFGKIVVFLVCFAVTATVTWQTNCVVKNGMYKSAHVLKISDLQNQIVNEKQKNQDLSSQLEEFQNYFKNIPNNAENKDYAEVLSKRLQQVETFAGLTDVEGAGVIINVSENADKNSSSSEIDNDAYLGMNNITHAEQLSAIVNCLFSADAEAVSINGQRLVSTSEIHCSGPTISINNKRFSQPYEIKAIGDPSNLNNALTMKGGIVELLRFYKINVEIKKNNNIQIGKYDGTLKNKYIKNAETTKTKTQ